MKLTHHFDIVFEDGIIVGISEAIVGRELTDTRWRSHLKWVELPIIEIDISRSFLRDTPSINLDEYDTPRKSTSRSDFITILIEDEVSHRLVCTECEMDLSSVTLIELYPSDHLGEEEDPTRSLDTPIRRPHRDEIIASRREEIPSSGDL